MFFASILFPKVNQVCFGAYTKPKPDWKVKIITIFFFKSSCHLNHSPARDPLSHSIMLHCFSGFETLYNISFLTWTISNTDYKPSSFCAKGDESRSKQTRKSLLTRIGVGGSFWKQCCEVPMSHVNYGEGPSDNQIWRRSLFCFSFS